MSTIEKAFSTERALDLALEVLEMVVVDVKTTPTAYEAHRQAITAIKQARSAPVQEPVGEVNRYGLDSHGRKWHGIHWYDPNVDVAHGTKLYTTPPNVATPLAAQRQSARSAWVGLTDRDAGEVIDYVHTNSRYGHHHTGFWMDFYRAIEAKLKEKNT